MKKLNKYINLLVLSIFSILCLSGCKKEEEILDKPLDFGVIMVNNIKNYEFILV